MLLCGGSFDTIEGFGSRATTSAQDKTDIEDTVFDQNEDNDGKNEEDPMKAMGKQKIFLKKLTKAPSKMVPGSKPLSPISVPYILQEQRNA